MNPRIPRTRTVDDDPELINNFTMVAFSPDSSDEDSLNLIKAKLRKRQIAFGDDTNENNDEDAASSTSAGVRISLANTDKENAQSGSSEHEKKIHGGPNYDWDDDSIPDEALEAAMLAAQSVQAKWHEAAQTTSKSDISPIPQSTSSPSPASHSLVLQETGIVASSTVLEPNTQDHTQHQQSIASQHENDSSHGTSSSSSSSSETPSETDVTPIPQQIVLPNQADPYESPTTSPHFQIPSKDSESVQDITPYASPEKPLDPIRHAIPEDPSPKTNSSSRKQNDGQHSKEVVETADSRIPVDNPFCVCEYASEDEWSFSELENKNKPPATKDDILDAFGLAISGSEQINSNGLTDDQVVPAVGEGAKRVSNVEDIHLVATEKDTSTDRVSEIDPSLYAPKPPVVYEPPIVHEFNLRTRPLNRRSKVSVHTVFQSPITRLWYSKFDSFNQMQSEMSNMLANSDDNVVVSAPTGAGKTAVFEMAMARFFSTDLEVSGANHLSKTRKIVYLSPSKALCEERYDDWSRRLQGMNLGIQLAVITGDGDPADSFHDLASSQFILTTPEKWDSLTRRWTEKFFLFASVKLLLIDEVHMIADGSRGCCLEATIMRMKTIQKAAQNVTVSQAELASSSYASTSPEAINSVFRMVAVSATLPNIADIAMFLEANEAHMFDGSYRPVPLTTHVVSTGRIGKNEFLFGKNLCESVPNTVLRFSDQKPTIVFCHSKNDTEKLADILARSNQIGSNATGMSNIASQTRLRKLQMAMMRGMAYHHAGLDVSDRRLVEKAFLEGKIKVLCATSTLAMGVNLPAHLVIVMGTRAWRGKAGYQDLEQASLLQMIGRAGRPGFDASGTAVILTDLDSKHKFETMASCGLPSAMSQCVGDKLVETLNTEIAQRVVTSVETASNWFMNTLYFIQDAKNAQSAGEIEAKVVDHCNSALEQLQTIGVVALSPKEEVLPLASCHVMSSNLVGLDAFRAIISIPHDASLCQLLKSLSGIEDLQRPLRKNEKKPLNAAQKIVNYHLEGAPSQVRVKENWEKVFVLLQVHISQLQMDCTNPTLDFTLRNETASMVDFASRMLAAIEEYSHKGSKNGHVVFQSLRLRRSLALQLWGPQDGVLGQIHGVSKEIVGKLRMNGITSFEDVIAKTAKELEAATSQEPPFGSNLQAACKNLLKSALKVEAKICTNQGSLTPDIVVCSLTPRLTTATSNRPSKSMDVKYSLIVYTDQPGGCLLYKENIGESGDHRVFAPPTYGKLSVRLVASICGLDDVMEIKGNIPVASSKAALSSSINDDKNRKNRIRTPGVKRKNPAQKTLEKKPRTSKSTHSKQSTCQVTTVLKDRIQNAGVAELRSKTIQQKKSAVASTISPSPKSNSTMPSLSSLPREFSSGKSSQVPNDLSRSESRSNNLHSSLKRTHATDSGHQSFPPNGESSKSEPLRSSYSDKVTERSSPFQPVHPSGWKRARSLQQKQQQRAFVRKKDNPFTLYSHDPNNSESFLEELSTKNRSQHATTSVLPQNPAKPNIASDHTILSQRPSWTNKSFSVHGRQRACLDRTTSSSLSEFHERHRPPRSFENQNGFRSSSRLPCVTAPLSRFHRSNIHQIPPISSHIRGPNNYHSPTLPRYGGHLYQATSDQYNFDDTYDQYEPPEQFQDDFRRTPQPRGYQERSPAFYSDQRVQAFSQRQEHCTPHSPYYDRTSIREPVHYAETGPEFNRQPHQFVDPRRGGNYEISMDEQEGVVHYDYGGSRQNGEAHYHLHGPGQIEDLYHYDGARGNRIAHNDYDGWEQKCAAESEYDGSGQHFAPSTGITDFPLPATRGHDNFATQQPTPASTPFGLNDDDLASAFL